MNALLFRPWWPHAMRGRCLMAVVAASFLFLWPGQHVFATTIGSWYLTKANFTPDGSPTPTSPFATVKLSVTGTDATFDIQMSSNMINKGGYTFGGFAFNWGDSSNITSQIQAALTAAGSPLNGWTITRNGGALDGFGKFNYSISGSSNGSRTNPVDFTMHLSGLGLSESQIFKDLSTFPTTASNGTSLFAADAKNGTSNTGFLGVTELVPSPEPCSLLLLSGCLAGLGAAGGWKRWRKAALVPS